jgi:hypothetical protein
MRRLTSKDPIIFVFDDDEEPKTKIHFRVMTAAERATSDYACAYWLRPEILGPTVAEMKAPDEERLHSFNKVRAMLLSACAQKIENSFKPGDQTVDDTEIGEWFDHLADGKDLEKVYEWLRDKSGLSTPEKKDSSSSSSSPTPERSRKSGGGGTSSIATTAGE